MEKTYVFEGIAGEKEKCAFFAGFFCKMNTASRKNKDNTYILGNQHNGIGQFYDCQTAQYCQTAQFKILEYFALVEKENFL